MGKLTRITIYLIIVTLTWGIFHSGSFTIVHAAPNNHNSTSFDPINIFDTFNESIAADHSAANAWIFYNTYGVYYDKITFHAPSYKIIYETNLGPGGGLGQECYLRMELVKGNVDPEVYESIFERQQGGVRLDHILKVD